MATVLIIDDDRDVVRLIEFALKRAGYQVLSATNGHAGLSITQSEKPDLVIADVMMPGLNGYEYCRQVRAQEELADIPILVFSARFQPIDRQTALEAGASDYLPKTVSPSELVAHVDALLRGAPSPAAVKRGRVIALFSLRGGAGVTSLAVNLSIAVALSRQQPVALIDMAPLAGHTALMLGMRPVGGLRKALESGDQVNTETLQPHWQAHDSGVQVLSSSVLPEEAGEMSVAAVQSLLDHLRQEFPVSLLDLPSMLTSSTAAALTVADRILLVVTPDVASLQSAAVSLQAINKLGLSSDSVWPVLNMPSGVGGLSPEAVANALKRPLVADIPYEPGMLSALNARRPLLLASPKSAAAQSIARLASELIS